MDIRCDFSNSNKDPQFQRMYICLGALKNGMKSGCRSVMGLNGAFLKSPFGGQLLTAVGVDANNNSWVIAYAMVENENKDSWIWFLELLCKDLDIKEDGVGWVFISDKQKGLIPACQMVVPSAEIRFCVRHMWTNFIKLFRGKVLKDQMWKCVRNTTMPYYLKDIEEMNDLDKDAYKWMTHEDRPPRHWCQVFFNTTSNCDIMDNNICESFNAVIVDARKKPPITMFEEIRWKLMKRIQMRRQIMDKYEHNICPKPRDTLEKNKIKSADCTLTFNGGDRFEVENIQGTKNVVDLRLRTCSCRS
uniref:uncharacterized protein LOC101315264 n=1 Tax=Fragaria vesca subsp. vesca TaxID=101020 RepID=UPI0005C8A9EB|nr:PREDICTED: uncharacterized protein LOC101315264 [Fragaria vesca subsp. vesca]